MRKVWLWGLVLALCGLSLAAGAQVEDLIGAADTAFDANRGVFEFDSYGGRLRTAIATYEQELPLIPPDAQQTRSHVLNCLSEAYFDLATGYLTIPQERKAAFKSGRDYALESLRLEPQFRLEELKSFRGALKTAWDVVALFWYANNLGRYLDYDWVAALGGGMKDVEACFRRTIELDEAYLAGGPWRALGSYLAQVPSSLGGDLDQAGEAFRRAIELGPDYVENHVNLAEDYAKAKKDWALFCEETRRALTLAQDAARFGQWPFYNTLALRRAQELAALEVGGSPVCPK